MGSHASKDTSNTQCLYVPVLHAHLHMWHLRQHKQRLLVACLWWEPVLLDKKTQMNWCTVHVEYVWKPHTTSNRELQISYIMKPQRRSETFNTPVKFDKHMLWRLCNYHKYQHSDLSITFMAHNYPIPLHQSMFPNHYCVICCYSVFEHHSVIKCHWVS